VLEYSKYSWKYRKRLGDYLTPVPRPRCAFYSKFCARSNVECTRREIRGGYLIYVIERAREGYLNNVIRILSHRSINAFRSYRTVRFCPGKARNAMASGSWTGEKLTRVDI
ncbi:hypothetical protein ALC57_13685, partial [Trachymyrmex cornetzi]